MDSASAVLVELRQKSAISIAGGCFVAYLTYLVAVVIYRLYFSPLAKFPGPKLAAISKWYEGYYEVVKRGQFTFHLNDLHDKYGPIVRITPYEVHIKDNAFWDTLYLRPKADRYDWMNGRFGNDTSIFTTSDHALHRVRRGALNPLFAKKVVAQFEPFIQQMVDEICHTVAGYKEEDRVLAVNRMWSAYACDAVTEYSFGFSYNQLKSDDFKNTFHDAFIAVSEFGHLALQIPWITPLLNKLPDSLAEAMNPPLAQLLQLQRDLRSIINRIRKQQEQGKLDRELEHRTLFHEMLQSDLSPEEKSDRRLADEAQTVIGAGLMTTAWALTNACFYLAETPRLRETLQAELREAVPDVNAADAFSFQKLEQLPYLRGCVQESIRFAHALSGRGPRVFDSPMQYESWTIPPRTPISMTIKDLHWDESFYPTPNEFVPERWLDDPKAPDGSPLDRYFMGFGKGPRICLGLNFAYMELFVALAKTFRTFSMELYETDRSDVEVAHDFFLPSARLDSKGVRVKITDVDPNFHR